jgi:hypothetical protein
MASKKVLRQAQDKKNRDKFLVYWKDHPNYTAMVHIVLGVGLGILFQTYFKEGYVNSVGWTLVFFGVLGHLYPYVA